MMGVLCNTQRLNKVPCTRPVGLLSKTGYQETHPFAQTHCCQSRKCVLLHSRTLAGVAGAVAPLTGTSSSSSDSSSELSTLAFFT